MQPPFTPEQFFEVFRRYNEALWPAQLGLIAVAFVAIVLAIRGNARESRFVSVILVSLWLWMAAAYLPFAARIMSRGTIAFGALFVAQAVLFGVYGVWKKRLEFRPRADATGVTGMLLLGYALVGYPLLGAAFGQRYPAAPTFGLPCPTAIFTLALLLWARPSVPRALLAVPLLWTVVATVAALTLGVWEDLGLTVAAVVVAALLLAPRTERRRGTREHAAIVVAEYAASEHRVRDPATRGAALQESGRARRSSAASSVGPAEAGFYGDDRIAPTERESRTAADSLRSWSASARGEGVCSFLFHGTSAVR